MTRILCRRLLAVSILLSAWFNSSTRVTIFAAATETLYVSATGHGVLCTKTSPCGLIQNAVNLAKSGDVISIGAGTFVENVVIAKNTSSLTLQGVAPKATIIQSAGGIPNQTNPDQVPVDIILDVHSPGTIVQDLSTLHPPGNVTKRDIGIFVRSAAAFSALRRLHVQRNRTGSGAELEPFVPGSRGILVFDATDVIITDSSVSGNYQDHVYIPTSNALVKNVTSDGATRLGIVITQELESSVAINNTITHNIVMNSASDGIQIQTGYNYITYNGVTNVGGYGIHLCGPESIGNAPCVPPGIEASADYNTVQYNVAYDDALGDIIDQGINNTVEDNTTTSGVTRLGLARFCRALSMSVLFGIIFVSG